MIVVMEKTDFLLASFILHKIKTNVLQLLVVKF